MARTVDRRAGLCLLGSAEIGPIDCEVPVLLNSGGSEAIPHELLLTHHPGTPGRRTLSLSRDDRTRELEFPVLAPEVAGGGPGTYPIGDRAILVHAPFDIDAVGRLRSERPELVVLGNARALWDLGEPFVEGIRTLRHVLGAGPLVWAPRVALPHRIPFLTYLGIDLVDTTEGLLRAADGTYWDRSLGPSDRESARREGRCPCAACSADPPGPLEAHARAEYRWAMAETRASVHRGRLRELVEARLVAEPVLAEMLRYADRDLAGPLEERTAVIGRASRNYVLAEAQRRPEVARFRARLLERYRPPPSKAVLLLVPCAKT